MELLRAGSFVVLELTLGHAIHSASRRLQLTSAGPESSDPDQLFLGDIATAVLAIKSSAGSFLGLEV